MPSVFWSMTFFELNSLMRGKVDSNEDTWSGIRYIAATVLNSRMGIKKNELIEPDDLKPKPKSAIVNRNDFVSTVESMKKVVPFKIA